MDSKVNFSRFCLGISAKSHIIMSFQKWIHLTGLETPKGSEHDWKWRDPAIKMGREYCDDVLVIIGSSAVPESQTPVIVYYI